MSDPMEAFNALPPERRPILIPPGSILRFDIPSLLTGNPMDMKMTVVPPLDGSRRREEPSR